MRQSDMNLNQHEAKPPSPRAVVVGGGLAGLAAAAALQAAGMTVH